MANFWQTLPKPFVALAPMEDVTDYVFREIICEIGKPDVLFTEFTSVDGLFSKGRGKVIQRFEYSERQHPIVAQVWGTKPDNFYKAGQLITELKFDGIDINTGCPVDDVVKKGAGVGLMKDLALTKEIIDATRKGAKGIPISIKTRLGYTTVETDTWIRFLLERQIDALTIHGRTAKELSKVPTHWDEIGKACQIRNKISPQTIIIGNGDVKDYDDALSKHQKYSVDGVMIGRGIFSNPWAFHKTQKLHTREENLDLLLTHCRLFVEKWGKRKNFAIMKKFFKIYVAGFDGASDLRQDLMSCSNYEQVEDIIQNNTF